MSLCVYLPSYSIQGLSYTRVILSPYLYLSSFSCSWYTFFAIITSSFSPFQVSVRFCIVQANCFLRFFLCPLNYLPSPFLLNIRCFLSVSSKLFINFYIVIMSQLSLLSFSVIRCISSNLSSNVRSSKFGTILVAILCILSNFNTCFLLWGDHIIFAYSNFGLIIVQ